MIKIYGKPALTPLTEPQQAAHTHLDQITDIKQVWAKGAS